MLPSALITELFTVPPNNEAEPVIVHPPCNATLGLRVIVYVVFLLVTDVPAALVSVVVGVVDSTVTANAVLAAPVTPPLMARTSVL